MHSSSDNDEDGRSSSELYELVYDELRQLAHAKMSREYAYSTLQGTALVHEAWLRLGGDDQPQWENRAHFFGAAAEAMRRILVDRARKRKRKKHGGELRRVSEEALDNVRSIDLNEQLLQVHKALDKLEAVDSKKAELVKLRYFFGMPIEEAAQNLNISRSTAKRWWIYARSWLAREMARE